MSISRSFPDRNKFESSTKKQRKEFSEALDRSFMYNKNNSGPSREPWGTPKVISFNDDLLEWYSTYCFLFVR